VTKCANEIEEFRCRFWEGKPVIYDKINTSFTYLDNDSELFKVVNVEMQDTVEAYVSLAADTVRKQKEYFHSHRIYDPIWSHNRNPVYGDFPSLWHILWDIVLS